MYVDDATSRLMELRFVASESAFDYLASTRSYLERHGKPVAFYSDKASIFRVAVSEAKRTAGITQSSRALSELNIDITCANTPEAGNAYLPEFLADYNERFAREPQSPHVAHRPVRGEEELALLFTWHEERKLSRNLTLHAKRVIYLVEPESETLPLAGERCCVQEYENRCIEVGHADKTLPCRVFFDKDPDALQRATASAPPS